MKAAKAMKAATSRALILVKGGGKVDHVGGLAADLWLSLFRINVRLSGQHKCH